MTHFRKYVLLMMGLEDVEYPHQSHAKGESMEEARVPDVNIIHQIELS